MLKIFFILITTMLVLGSCKKDPPEINDLPEITAEGKNTFGCYIDGESFVASVDFTIGGTTALSGYFDEETDYLVLQGARENANGNLDKVVLLAYIDNGTGSYTLHATSDNYVGYRDFSGSRCTYYYDESNLGQVKIIHLDTSTNIISGFFSMELINSDCYYKTMKITEGRFDFRY